jgi:hypothetical protein
MLTINPPPPLTARLVFMADDNWQSRLIRFDEVGAVSHVAAMIDDGLFVAANVSEGVQRKRPIDELAGVTLQITVDIPMKQPEYDEWRDYLYGRCGEPFDTLGIAGIATHFDLHTQGAIYCAALQVGALRKCMFFPRPLAQKFHMISPVVLLLMLQAQPLSTGVVVHDVVHDLVVRA